MPGVHAGCVSMVAGQIAHGTDREERRLVITRARNHRFGGVVRRLWCCVAEPGSSERGERGSTRSGLLRSGAARTHARRPGEQPCAWRRRVLHQEWRGGVDESVRGCRSTVPDFARFVAATVSGPGSEPPGRGVLKRETISTLLETLEVEKFLGHSGANPGWYARFLLNVERREGFVIANNSSRGGRVNESIGKLWSDACRDTATVREQR